MEKTVRKILSKMEQKIWGYLKDRKTPVGQQEIADYFLVTKTSVSKALRDMELAGIVIVTWVGRRKKYRANLNEFNNG